MIIRKCYIWDLDGTLVDSSHRAHHLQSSPIDWGAYYEKIGEDFPIMPALRLFVSCRINSGKYWDEPVQIISTMRCEKYRDQTERWLMLYNMKPDHLLMQNDDDRRSAAEVKAEHLWTIRNTFNLNPILAFDDHQPVVDMYRTNGVLCYQTAPSGKF